MQFTDSGLNGALRYYPQCWHLWQNLRKMVLEAYVPSLSMSVTGIVPQAAYYRNTDSAAIALVTIDDRYRTWRVIGRFIDTELMPEERPLLIDVWRGFSPGRLAEKYGESYASVISRWEALVSRLNLYINQALGNDTANAA